jgi:hypothetical protein
MKKAALIVGGILGLYLTCRAIAEPFVIHWRDPASYRADWGGPSLAGVLGVHCLPGLLLPGAIITRLLRHRAARLATP